MKQHVTSHSIVRWIQFGVALVTGVVLGLTVWINSRSSRAELEAQTNAEAVSEIRAAAYRLDDFVARIAMLPRSLAVRQRLAGRAPDPGLGPYLRHYLAPSPLLLPFHLLGELSRTLALAVRLFGNIMSLEMAALLVLLVAGLLVPIPVLMLHIIEALVQAYIFGTLALIYIAGGMQSGPDSSFHRSGPSP